MVIGNRSTFPLRHNDLALPTGLATGLAIGNRFKPVAKFFW